MAANHIDSGPELLTFPRADFTKADLKYAEAHIVDLALFDQPGGKEKLVEILKKCATEGLFHIVNHGIPADLLELQRDVAWTYYTTTSLEQKDADTTKNESGLFEGYKLRTPEEKESNKVPTIEEYNYDFYATGKVTRPPIMEKYETEVAKVYEYYHDVLIPKLMKLLSLLCGFEEDHFGNMHDSSKPNSEIAHYLIYHTEWEQDNIKKRASYAGHTDIGSVTLLYCNPVACLQVYTAEGWRFVPYVENSLIVNIGDCLESLTGGRFPAALHRLVKFQEDQKDFCRIALVYFVHPHDDIIREHFRLEEERRESLRGTNMLSGQEINRLIMALSADNEDQHAKIIDESQWNSAKSGQLVVAPEELSFDYDARTITRRSDSTADNLTVAGTPSSLTVEQVRVIQALAKEVAAENGKVKFDGAQWMETLEVINRTLALGQGGTADVRGTGLPEGHEAVLSNALKSIKPTAAVA